MTMPKKPLTDQERQTFIDNLPADQVNLHVEETFNDALARAAQPQQLKPERPAAGGDYSGKQTRSRKTANTSGKRSGKSHQSNA